MTFSIINNHNIQNAELMDDNSRLEKMLRTPQSDFAKEEQIQNFRLASKARFSSLRGKLESIIPCARKVD